MTRKNPYAASTCRILLSLGACGVLTESAHCQTTIAHWSFDTPTITTGPTGITAAADQTGMHNATTVIGGAGMPINSVAGQFGQAAQFTNVNANGVAQTEFSWMSYPQLREIAGPTAGDFSIAAWTNVPDQESWDVNTIIADWGIAPANTDRFTYWFSLQNAALDGVTNVTLRPRGQIRSQNSHGALTPPNIDIIAKQLTDLEAAQPDGTGPIAFDDGMWHHVVWTWTKEPGEMRFYTDGVLRHTQTTGQAVHDVLVSESDIGGLGAKPDNNRYFSGTMDEVWVFNGALSDEQVLNLKNTNSIGAGPVGNPADFNSVGGVDGADLAIWKTNFGTAGATKAKGDADNDADVDGHDFLIWQRNLGAAAVGAAAAVPEPSAAAMFAAVAGYLASRRRRTG